MTLLPDSFPIQTSFGAGASAGVVGPVVLAHSALIGAIPWIEDVTTGQLFARVPGESGGGIHVPSLQCGCIMSWISINSSSNFQASN